MKAAVVLGGGATLWDDLSALHELVGPWPGLVMAVNDAGWAYPGPIDAWVTLHPAKLPEWMEKRHRRGHDMGFEVWGGRWVTGTDDLVCPWVDHVMDVRCHPASGMNGSSGMHAIEVARVPYGCDRITLCGVPMDVRPHFFSDRNWDSPIAHRDTWVSAASDYRGVVKSFSGWTSEYFGIPDADWLRVGAPL